jgi:hypothetical protein
MLEALSSHIATHASASQNRFWRTSRRDCQPRVSLSAVRALADYLLKK